MKTLVSERNSSHGLFTTKLSLICTLIVLIAFGGIAANKDVAKAGPTEAYWNKLHTAANATEAEQILSNFKQTEPTKESLKQAAGALNKLANQLEDSCQQIAVIPVLNVDSELLQYSAAYVKNRTEGIIFLNEYATLLLQAKELLNGEQWLADLVISAMKHSDKRGEAWKHVLTEQLTDKGVGLAAIKPKMLEIQRQAMDISNQVSRLKAEEMQLRLNLSKKYNREFLSGDTFKRPITSPLKTASKVEIPVTKMQQDLLGKSINDGSWWRFDDMKEYNLFHVIKSNQMEPNSIQYQVVSRVKGMYSGNVRTVWLNLEYRQQNGQWNLTGFAPF